MPNATPISSAGWLALLALLVAACSREPPAAPGHDAPAAPAAPAAALASAAPTTTAHADQAAQAAQAAQVARTTAPPAGHSGGDAEPVLNVYNWSDFIEPSVVADFEREFGIKVHYDMYVSDETMEVKLLAGHSSYDVVVPGGPFFEKEIKAGIYQKLDKSLLPNLRDTAVNDPGNLYGADYMWLVAAGVGYDRTKILARLGDAPLTSWRLVFDPAVVAKFRDCGVSLLDAPEDVLSATLAYLGKDPRSESLEDLAAAEAVWKSIRPAIRDFDSSRYFEDLANGDLCLVLGWSGDIAQSRVRARQAGKPATIEYVLPAEGSVSTVDVLAIPADAPHPRNAHLFINYLLRPEVAARNAATVSYASGVAGSAALLPVELREDPAVYPPEEVRRRLVMMRAKTPQFTRALMRAWTRFKTGQ
jgi:putrescine transport system substrate-binding protein